MNDIPIKKFVKEFKTPYKVLYYLGCIKHKGWKDNGQTAIFGFRLWNPLSWIVLTSFFLVMLTTRFIFELIPETVGDTRRYNKQEVITNLN